MYTLIGSLQNKIPLSALTGGTMNVMKYDMVHEILVSFGCNLKLAFIFRWM
jgi:hypothetical protein